jgi:hypothetical protein
MAEIDDIIDSHKKAGLENPVFQYDEESMFWFINFLKVGESKKRINVEEVYKTINSIIDSLKTKDTNEEVQFESLRQKYFDAINLFYTKRYRPTNKKLLCPKV